MELFLTLEDMIYTREANPLRMTLPLKVTEIHSAKKSVDAEILDKFPLVTTEYEKPVIQDVPLKYSHRTFSAKQNDQILQNIISSLTVDNPELGSSSQNLQDFKTASYFRAFPSKKTATRPANAGVTYNRKPSLQQTHSNHAGSSKTSEQSTSRNNISQAASNMARDEFEDTEDYAATLPKPTKTISQKQPQSKVGESSMDIFNEFDSVVGNKSSMNSSSSSSQKQKTQTNVAADDIFDLPAKALNMNPNIQKQPSTATVDLLDLDPDDVDNNQNEEKKSSDKDFNNFEMFNSTIGGPIPNQTFEKKIDLESIKGFKHMEKLNLCIKNGKIEEFGENNFYLGCEGESYLWEDSKRISKKPSSTGISISSHKEHMQKLTLNHVKDTQPVVDFIINPKCLDSTMVPLFFVFKSEANADGNVEITMQYKTNDKIQYALYDVEIGILFKTKLPSNHVKTNPAAHVVEGNKVAWRTKGLQPNSKGKLAVLVAKASVPENSALIDCFRINFKAPAATLDDLKFYITTDQKSGSDQFSNEKFFKPATKKLFVEYKILA